MTQRLENILNSKRLFINSPTQRDNADCVCCASHVIVQVQFWGPKHIISSQHIKALFHVSFHTFMADDN